MPPSLASLAPELDLKNLKKKYFLSKFDDETSKLLTVILSNAPTLTCIHTYSLCKTWLSILFHWPKDMLPKIISPNFKIACLMSDQFLYGHSFPHFWGILIQHINFCFFIILLLLLLSKSYITEKLSAINSI